MLIEFSFCFEIPQHTSNLNIKLLSVNKNIDISKVVRLMWKIELEL